ncbi:uncharacterized protein METZ01_LOCUS305571 [marine metagenome]|uniref:Uncharacterized protein n=1 Tax=marine metagenome TaxID=408172 RepID=A0A382MY40_9ZZZZ
MNILPNLLFFILVMPLSLLYADEEEKALDLVYQKLNSIEQEIAVLRSLIEENSYLIERYQELQQQRYIDLDQRLLDALSKDIENQHNPISLEQSENEDDEFLVEEISLYQNALELFNSARYAEALEAFREQIISFPEGRYSADAYFWSGELYLAQQRMQDARENYFVVVEKFPSHSRASDSLYKLGLISRNLGQENDAVSYFLKILEDFPESGVSQLAEKALEITFPESN